jgi:uncharacterized protein (UPF0297 family)
MDFAQHVTLDTGARLVKINARRDVMAHVTRSLDHVQHVFLEHGENSVRRLVIVIVTGQMDYVCRVKMVSGDLLAKMTAHQTVNQDVISL